MESDDQLPAHRWRQRRPIQRYLSDEEVVIEIYDSSESLPETAGSQVIVN